MPKFVLRDVAVRFNGLEQSNYVKSLTITEERDEIDVTALGAEYRETWSADNQRLTLDLRMFLGNTTVDQTLRDALRDGTAVAVAVSPRNDVASPTNPVWEPECLVMDMQTFGDVGDAAMTQITLKSTGSYDIATAEALLPFMPLWSVTVLA